MTFVVSVVCTFKKNFNIVVKSPNQNKQNNLSNMCYSKITIYFYLMINYNY